jgi:hypothetical protein
MAPNFQHILGYEQIRPLSITTSLIDIDADLTFNEHQALSLRLENLVSDPVAGNPGRLIWRSDVNEVFVDNGTSFVPVATGADVSSINGLTGDITLSAGTNISISSLGNTITISSPNTLLASNFVIGETPSGTLNGINKIFTLANTPLSDKESVFSNGVKLKRGPLNVKDYFILGGTITFSSAPQSMDILLVDYIM